MQRFEVKKKHNLNMKSARELNRFAGTLIEVLSPYG